jgi:DNA primase
MALKFPSSWIDDLYSRVDIVQVVSSYLPLKKEGSRYWGLCPFHNEKTASFSVTQELNLYHCFGCKAGGNVIQFVMEMERSTFFEAAKQLAEQFHVQLPENTEDARQEQNRGLRERLFSANIAAAKFFHDSLWTVQGASTLDYLHKRGLDESVIRRFGLGAATAKWDDLTQHLISSGFTLDEIKLAGLCVVKDNSCFDMFRNRAMFPIIDLHGQIQGFGGRSIGDVQPKYLNTSDTPVFNKRLGLYGINNLKKAQKFTHLILVEGYMDVIALAQNNIPGVVATLGTSLTNEQARLIKRFASEVWVSYDGDRAGQHAILRALDIFDQEGIPARVLDFPDNLDPDDFIRQRGAEAFTAIQPINAIAYRMLRVREDYDLSTQDGRTDYAKKCAVILQKVSEPVEMENHIQSLMIQTGFPREVLWAQINSSPVKPAAAKPDYPRKLRIASHMDSESLRTEQALLSMMAAGFLPPGLVRKEDFTETHYIHLAESLLSGQSPASLLTECDDEPSRILYNEAFNFQANIRRENAISIAEDCLRKIKATRIQERIEEIKHEMPQMDSAMRIKALQETMELSSELTQLKHKGR